MQSLLVQEGTRTEFKCKFKSNLEKWITVPDVTIYHFCTIKIAQYNLHKCTAIVIKSVGRQKLLDIYNPHLI